MSGMYDDKEMMGDYWSPEKTHKCKQCKRKITQREYNARDGICQVCWGQVKNE